MAEFWNELVWPTLIFLEISPKLGQIIKNLYEALKTFPRTIMLAGTCFLE